MRVSCNPSLQIEQDLLRSSFAALAKQMDLIFRKRLWFIMIEQFLMKYMWGLSGICISMCTYCIYTVTAVSEFMKLGSI